MAMLVTLIILLAIFQPSKSLEPFLGSFRSQNHLSSLVDDEYKKQSSIRQVLLEKLNKFSGKNSQKLVMFRPNTRYHDYSPINFNEKHEQNDYSIIDNQYHATKILPTYQATLTTTESINPTEMHSKISQNSAEKLDEWKQIRERRLRFYKVRFNES